MYGKALLKIASSFVVFVTLHHNAWADDCGPKQRACLSTSLNLDPALEVLQEFQPLSTAEILNLRHEAEAGNIEADYALARLYISGQLSDERYLEVYNRLRPLTVTRDPEAVRTAFFLLYQADNEDDRWPFLALVRYMSELSAADGFFAVGLAAYRGYARENRDGDIVFTNHAAAVAGGRSHTEITVEQLMLAHQAGHDFALFQAALIGSEILIGNIRSYMFQAFDNSSPDLQFLRYLSGAIREMERDVRNAITLMRRSEDEETRAAGQVLFESLDENMQVFWNAPSPAEVTGRVYLERFRNSYLGTCEARGTCMTRDPGMGLMLYDSWIRIR